MRISIIIPDITRAGGTERAVVTLANMLCVRYSEIHILSMTKTDVQSSYYQIDERVSVFFLDNKALQSKVLHKIKWSINTVSQLNKYFKENKTDLIISTGHNYNWLLYFIKVSKHVKKIACEHIVYSSIPRLSRFFMRLTYPFLDQIVVLSDTAAKSFNKYSKVAVIPNAIPFKTAQKSALIEKQILMVGRLSPEKGIERLIPIASLIKKKISSWKIIILGDGPERNSIEEQIKQADLNDFILLKGSVKDVQSYYLSSSIYIMTSHFEAFPMVLLEAQSFGLPIISYNCPEGPAQIVDNNTGFLIDNGNFNDFSEKILMLIENEEMRKEMGENGKNNANKFSEDKILLQWESLIDKITV
ncbi:glycosyltransferase family 4 protein [Flavobacterium sharifuzzamanii]|uniref:glycosyltransferase family 4 protein n=1 Tax=Flavobacterium sharifuzzamanii TaxID=2211133 RepID=UPI000DABC675|nr:glycosyltransferase family 4 protein [Flavobacterium sharifuzzamanii]KAF2081156.1 glycosyltransferase family 4 protein [Flavobacterium sharifuzzamanii]